MSEPAGVADSSSANHPPGSAPIIRVLEICNKKGCTRAPREVRANRGKIRLRGEGQARPRGRRRHLDHGPDDAGGRPGTTITVRSERAAGGRGRRRAGGTGERAVHGTGIRLLRAWPTQATSFLNTLAAGRRSATKLSYSRCWSASSSMRSSQDGLDGHEGGGAVGRCKVCPRSLPIRDRTAEQTCARPWRRARQWPPASRSRARDRAKSCSARFRRPLGRLCRRRLPRISCLKCFTALVTRPRCGQFPPSASARSRTRPAGPTNGLPLRSSLVAGLLADEHEMSDLQPSPGTVCVASFIERTARAFVLRLGEILQRIDLGRKLEIKLRLLSHRALLANRRWPCRVNAGSPRQFGAGASLRT